MLTITFDVSSIGVFGMIFLKIYEVKRKRKAYIGIILSKFDSKIHNRINELALTYDTGKEKASLFVKQEIPRQSKYFMFLTKKMAKEKLDFFWPNIRGSRILRRNGDVSAFLRDIAKHKKENGGGRIDEEEITDSRPAKIHDQPPTANS